MDTRLCRKAECIVSSALDTPLPSSVPRCSKSCCHFETGHHSPFPGQLHAQQLPADKVHVTNAEELNRRRDSRERKR